MTGLPRTLELAGEQVTVREAEPYDVELIFPTWMESARQLRQTRRAVFNRFYESIVRDLLETEPAVVLTKSGGSTIHAWACGRPPNLLHFAYVPYALRNHGLGRAVIEAVLGNYPSTVWVTSSPCSIPDHKRFIYNPYVLRRQ